MGRGEAFESTGGDEAVIERKQLVEKGRSGAPKTDDEERRRSQFELVDAPGKTQRLHEVHDRVEDRKYGDLQGEGDPARGNSEMVARQQAEPCGSNHAVPHPEMMARIAPAMGRALIHDATRV